MEDDHDTVVYSGNWVNGVTEDFDAALQISFFGEEVALTLGTDVDRSICDVLVNNVFWGSLDTYAATAGQLEVTIPLARLGQHTLEIRNRPERNKAAVPTSSTSFKLEFVQMETLYDGQTLQYSYDDLSRLLAADYFAAWDAVNPVREYDFSYDIAGNRTQEILTVDGGTPTQIDYTYDAANRISSAGFAYNDTGQMTADGTLSYSWDRAGRLLGAGDSSYAYNGLGQRVQQTVSGVVTEYLLDVQPGLAKVIAATTGANTERFVHERGLLSQQDSVGDWHWAVNDGPGSVRVQADSNFDVEGSRLFAPYGAPFDEQGAFSVPFAFTGEMLDENGLQYHRARYLNPALGVFPSLDPVEGMLQQAMSLNRYAYVAGNVVNMVDPSGMFGENPGWWDRCQQEQSCSQCIEDNLSYPGYSVPFGAPYLYAAWLACQHVCPPYYGTSQPSISPTNTPPGNPCNPANLPPNLKSEMLATFSGTLQLDSERYQWWDGAITGVKITFYGTRALRDTTATSPAQLSPQEAKDICCGQGSVAIGSESYRCNLPFDTLSNLCAGASDPGTVQFSWIPSGRCSPHPFLANETCAVSGKTGAVKPETGVAGNHIGRVFAYVIPSPQCQYRDAVAEWVIRQPGSQRTRGVFQLWARPWAN